MNLENNVTYELTLTEDEARTGVSKLLIRNNKKLQVSIPAGVTAGNVVKLTNALQVTDSKPGDILIRIRIQTKSAQTEKSPSGGVVEINENNFESEVLKSDIPVVVDFWAPWCGPCRMMAPVMERMADKYAGRVKFCKINVDENPGIAARYQAMSIPLLVFFRNGQVVDRSVGAITDSQLKIKLDSLF